MKQIHLFIYSDSKLDLNTTLFIVPVGVSVSDQSAFKWLRKFVASDNRFFFQKNSLEVANFLEKCLMSFTGNKISSKNGLYYWQSVKITPSSLKKVLQKYPLEFLNTSAFRLFLSNENTYK